MTLTATLTLGEAKEVKTFKLTVVAADDKVAPAFMGLVDGKLPAIEHLATQTVDLMEGVTARDNKDNYDVTLTLRSKKIMIKLFQVFTQLLIQQQINPKTQLVLIVSLQYLKH